jgi:tetratricopeptide (TPR) repeat protein
MSLGELHDRLDQRFRLLTGGSRTALGRQRTLAATVAWSYSLLTGAERVLLGRLSVFADSFGLVAAADVACLIDLPTARQLAEQAVHAARQVGDERLLSRALASLCAAHFFPGEPETGRPFGQESVERARRLGDDVQLAQSLLGYLLTIDPARSGPLYAEAIACTERSGDHFIKARLHNDAGVSALGGGDIPAARAHLEAAAQAAQQIGYEHALVPANLGGVLRAETDLDGARSAFEASLRIGRRNGENWSLAFDILGLACLAGDAGDWDRAAALHGAAQALQDRTGNPWQEFAARDRRDSLDQARARLGGEQLERAYAQGRALSLDQALDLALPKAGPA